MSAGAWFRERNEAHASSSLVRIGARAGAIVRFDTVTVIMIADGMRYWTISYENHGPSRDHMARTVQLTCRRYLTAPGSVPNAVYPPCTRGLYLWRTGIPACTTCAIRPERPPPNEYVLMH